PIGITVSDLDRSVAFYTNVLGFREISEREVAGEDLEHLEGVFGLRMRVARLDDVAQSLRAERATLASPGPVTLSDHSLGFSRGLVRDPDGHVLEVVE